MATAKLTVVVEAAVAKFQRQFEEASRSAEKFEKAFAGSASSVTAHQKRINDAFASFSGDKLARETMAVAKAVEQVGGASKLTATEQAKVNALMTEATEKYKALGQTAPKAMTDLAAATAKVPEKLSLADRAAGSLKSTFTQMFAAFTLVNLVDKAVSSLVSFGKEAFDTAGKIVDLSSKTGLTTKTIQQFQHVAEQTGTDLESFTRASFMLGVNLEKSKGSVEGLGTSFEALRALRPDEQFAEVARRLEAIEDPQKRNTIAVSLFGKAAQEVLPAIAQGYSKVASEATIAADEQVRALEAAGDAWDKFVRRQKTAFLGFLGNQVVAAQTISKLNPNQQDQYATLLATDAGKAMEFLTRIAKMHTDVNLATEKTIASTVAWGDELKQLDRDLSHLTAARLADLKAGLAMNKNEEEIAGQIGLTAEHVKRYKDNLQAATQRQKEFSSNAQQFAKMLADDVVQAYEETRLALKSYYEMILKANEGIEDGIPALSKRSQVELKTITATVDQWQMYLGLIDSVNSKIKIGLDNAPGLSIDPKVLGGDFLKKEAKTVGDQFGRELSQAIVGAIQGGGDIGKTIGAVIGKTVGESLGKSLASAVGNKFGSALGGMLGPLGAIGGQMIGGLFDKIFGKSQNRKNVESFADSFGGFDKLQKQLQTLPKHADTLWKALTQGGAKSKDAIDAITEAFRLQEEAMRQTVPTYADASAAAERLGLDITKIGDGMNQLRVNDSAAEIAAAWDTLERAGADMEQVATGAAGKFQEMVLEALKWGHTLPEEMRDPLQKMADMGLITDETGEKLLDLDRIKFEKPLQAAIDGLIVKLDELISKITNGLGGALRGVPDLNMNVPQLGSGGIVRKPTLALVGESGPEAVVPLGSAGLGSSQPIVVKTYLDGRLVAESTARHLPYVLGRTG